jgi:hypothetical protein
MPLRTFAMLARLQTFSLPGIDAVPVDMEVDVSTGALPSAVHRMVLTAYIVPNSLE